MYTLYVAGVANSGCSTWGLVPTQGGTRLKIQAGCLHNSGAARALLVGLISGLGTLAAASIVEVYTRSAYLLKGIKHWLPIWAERSWHNNDGRTIMQVELWEEVWHLLQLHDIRVRVPPGADPYEEALNTLIALTQKAPLPAPDASVATPIALMIGDADVSNTLEERMASAVLYARKHGWRIRTRDCSSGAAACVLRWCCELGAQVTYYGLTPQPENPAVHQSLFAHYICVPFKSMFSPLLQPYLRSLHPEDETPLWAFLDRGQLAQAALEVTLIEEADRVYYFSDAEAPPLVYIFTRTMTSKPCAWVRSLPAIPEAQPSYPS